MLLAYMCYQGLFSEFYAVAGAVFYIGCFWVFYRAGSVSISQCLVACRRGLLPLSAWLVAGAGLKLGFEVLMK